MIPTLLALTLSAPTQASSMELDPATVSMQVADDVLEGLSEEVFEVELLAPPPLSTGAAHFGMLTRSHQPGIAFATGVLGGLVGGAIAAFTSPLLSIILVPFTAAAGAHFFTQGGYGFEVLGSFIGYILAIPVIIIEGILFAGAGIGSLLETPRAGRPPRSASSPPLSSPPSPSPLRGRSSRPTPT